VRVDVRCLQSRWILADCGLVAECATLGMLEDDDRLGLGLLVAQNRSAGERGNSFAIHSVCTHYQFIAKHSKSRKIIIVMRIHGRNIHVWHLNKRRISFLARLLGTLDGPDFLQQEGSDDSGLHCLSAKYSTVRS
jgi:hypothetical protein